MNLLIMPIHDKSQYSKSIHVKTQTLYSVISLLAVCGCASVQEDVPQQQTIVDVPIEQKQCVAENPIPVEPPKPVVTKGKKKTTSPKGIAIFTWDENSIYKIPTTPGFFTSIFLEPGERINSKILGDSACYDKCDEKSDARWSITETRAGITPIVLIQPVEAGISTNFLISTNKRAYQINVTSSTNRVTDRVQWTYPKSDQEQLPVARFRDSGESCKPWAINSNYKIQMVSGELPKWVPAAAYDCGAKMYVRFPDGLGRITMPAVFALNDGAISAVSGRVVEDDRKVYEVDYVGDLMLRNGDTSVRITK